MTSGYTKLFSTLITSTVWQEPHHVRIVWITMLALRNHRHEVEASLPGLAKIAGVTLAECSEAITKFESPDPYSRSPENEGRRIAKTNGGWLILNGEKYRQKLSAEERKEYKADWARRKRQELRGERRAVKAYSAGDDELGDKIAAGEA